MKRAARDRVYAPLAPLDAQLKRWRREIGSRRTRAIFDHAAARIDREGHARLQEKHHAEAAVADDSDVLKYLDIAPWLMVHARIAAFLDIDERPPCSILDIGAGGGQFLAIAKAYGHEVTALDMPEPEIYRDLLALFGIPRIEGGVDWRAPLPAPVGRYDLIVIHGQVFDRVGRSSDRWRLPEWIGFLRHLAAQHLDLPGEIFLGLNRSVDTDEGRDYLWPLVELARSHGARTQPGRPFMHFRLAQSDPFPGEAGIDWPATRQDAPQSAHRGR